MSHSRKKSGRAALLALAAYLLGAAWAPGAQAAAPETFFTHVPDAVTDQSTPKFEFGSTTGGATFRCSMDGALSAACESPFLSEPLATGNQQGCGPLNHVFRVAATGANGEVDQTPATYHFTVTPNTTFTFGPAAVTSTTTPIFGFASSVPGSTFRCAMDGSPLASCTSAYISGVLQYGNHVFRVVAADAQGNADPTPAEHRFKLVPETTIVSAPPAFTSDPRPQFTFTSGAAGAVFGCRVDSGNFSSCRSPFTTPLLADGRHEVRIQSNAAGILDPTPAVHSFTVDTIAPQTLILSGPDPTSFIPTPTFELDAVDATPVALFCRIDAGPSQPCRRSFTTDPLALGGHVLAVTAVDAAGTADPTPAIRAFEVAVVPGH